MKLTDITRDMLPLHMVEFGMPPLFDWQIICSGIVTSKDEAEALVVRLSPTYPRWQFRVGLFEEQHWRKQLLQEIAVSPQALAKALELLPTDRLVEVLRT